MKIKISLILMIMILSKVNAQIKPIQIGEKMPDVLK
jgi:hypothetical protein